MTETHIRGYNGETERDRSTESTESTAEEAESTEERTTTCPECEGNLITDTEHGETVCSECGLVVEQDSVDRGPEWRAFDSSERDSKSRGGPDDEHDARQGALDEHRLAGQRRLREVVV